MDTVRTRSEDIGREASVRMPKTLKTVASFWSAPRNASEQPPSEGFRDDETLLESSFVVPTECLGEVAETVRATEFESHH